MILSDTEIKQLVAKGLLVKDMVDPCVQIQQCCVDLTVAKIFTMKGEGILDFSNEKRKLPEYVEVSAEGDRWMLKPGVYHIAFNETIVLPKDIAGLVLPRSSALVCGIVEHSALWDPGYTGRSFLHVEVSRPVTIFRNARVAQMIFFKLGSESAGYQGVYNK